MQYVATIYLEVGEQDPQVVLDAAVAQMEVYEGVMVHSSRIEEVHE